MESMINQKISFKVFGERALFSDPITRVGGEKSSYLVPTYQALKGIVENIYWKPTIIWEIEKIRVLNPIKFETCGMRPICYHGDKENELAYYTYLKNVAYEVVAKFKWNENRKDLSDDRNYKKHIEIAERSLKKGGRRGIFLGTSECPGYVEPCEFGKSFGAYDEIESMEFGLMFHSFIYPDEAFDENSYGNLSVTFWNPSMKKGIIEFKQARDLEHRRVIHKQEMKQFVIGKNMNIVESN